MNLFTFPFRFAIHHLGVLRKDRTLVEKPFFFVQPSCGVSLKGCKYITPRKVGQVVFPIVWCTKLMWSDADERVNIEVVMWEKGVEYILRELAGDWQAKKTL